LLVSSFRFCVRYIRTNAAICISADFPFQITGNRQPKTGNRQPATNKEVTISNAKLLCYAPSNSAIRVNYFLIESNEADNTYNVKEDKSSDPKTYTINVTFSGAESFTISGLPEEDVDFNGTYTKAE
jgi:hypothetical protein